jgi:hypothetical protein
MGNYTRLGIYYNADNKSVSFYKNGINQGVAFNGVKENLTVSLDVWFEYGTIEIIKTITPKQNNYIDAKIVA